MAVVISSEEELRAWLEDKPRDWAQVVALRCALRVAPLVCDPTAYQRSSFIPRWALAVVRATAVLTAASNYLFGDTAVAAAAAAYDAAVSAITTNMPPPHVFDAASAAAIAAYTVEAKPDSGDAARTFLSGATAASAAAVAVVRATAAVTLFADDDAVLWRAVSRDCDALEGGQPPEALLAAPLWDDRPEWFDQSWGRAARWLSRKEDGFEIWREWYFGRLEGKPHAFANFDEAADREFSTRLCAKDNDWWAREPSAVNAEIAGWVEELRKPDPIPDSEPVNAPDSITLTPKQIAVILKEIASPQAVIQDGTIAFRANAEFETPDGELDAWHPRHLLALIELLTNGLSENAPNALKIGLAKYGEVLARDPDLPVIATLQSAMGVIRATYQSDGCEFWGNGLSESFAELFRGHERLLRGYPRSQERRQLRDQITPTDAAKQIAGLGDDIQRFSKLANQLQEFGVTNEAAHAHLQSIIDIATQIAYGSNAGEASQSDDEVWTPPAVVRIEMTGVMARIESQLSLLVSLTGHPQVQFALFSVSAELARWLTYFV